MACSIPPILRSSMAASMSSAWATPIQCTASVAISAMHSRRLSVSALAAYLLGGTAGIVAGGSLAVRTARHDRVAGTGLLAGAALLAIVATGIVPRPLIVPMFVVTGFVLGATSPSRDLIVRNATPKGAAGRG